MMTDDRETLIELRKRDDKIAALTIERDDAQARLRELEATTTAATIRDVHKALGAAPGQSVVARAQDVMASAAHEASERIRLQVDLDAAHTRIGQMQVEHARVERRWLANPTQQAVLDILGIAAGDRTDPIGRIKALVECEDHLVLIADAVGRRADGTAVDWVRDIAKRNTSRTADLTASAVQILRDALLLDGDDDIEDLAKMAADQITGVRAALRWEGEGSCGTLVEHARDIRGILDDAPLQTFRPPISVTISNAGGIVFADVRASGVTDPAFLTLPMGVRLGLVVLRD